MHSNFIQLPPDSTGKKLLVQRTLVLTVDNNTGVREGDVLVTSLTNNTLRISASIVIGGAHMVHAMFLARAAETASEIQVGETLNLNGVVKATIIAPEPYYEFFNLSMQVSADNPYNGQLIDNKGASYTRFAEGEPAMDAFGNLKTSQSQMIGVYDFSSDSADALFSDYTVGGGSVDYMVAQSCVSISTDMAANSFASRTSDKYHFYWPGNGNLIMMTVALGGLGIIGCARRWGFFDQYNGLYFAYEDDQLRITVRNSTSGTLVKTHHPQSTWNGDRLDGTGLSKMIINLSTINIWWMDYQWLGGGRVRAGIIGEGGERIVCHTIHNANVNNFAYMQSGSLPIQFNCQNHTMVGAAPSIRMTCCSVRTEGYLDYTYWRYTLDFAEKTLSSTAVPLLSLMSKQTYLGKYNVTSAYPESFTYYISEGAVKIDFYLDVIALTGAVWNIDNGSTVLADETASAFSNEAVPVHSFFLEAGAGELELSEYFEVNDIGLSRRNNPALDPLILTVFAKKIAGNPVIQGCLNYRELR